LEETCYLCGKKIGKKNRTLDHIPPKQFFPSALIRKGNIQLITLPAHKKCNEYYQKDEEYFRLSIGASACGNPILDGIWEDIKRMVGRPKTQSLRLKVFSEFIKEVRTQSGIILPGIVAKTYDAKRIFRVVWKIIRGFYVIEFSNILPEQTEHFVSYVQKDTPPVFSGTKLMDLFYVTLLQEERGNYKEVFWYRYFLSPRKDFYTWAILFWSRHLFFVFHHMPDCNCGRCKLKQS